MWSSNYQTQHTNEANNTPLQEVNPGPLVPNLACVVTRPPVHLILTTLLYTLVGSDGDLEYYVRECGDILGVSKNLAVDSRDAKHILEYIMAQVVEFKKLNQVGERVAV